MGRLTTFTLARFDRSQVPRLLATVPLERLRLRRQPGMAWGRHLGTSAGGRTQGADPSRWAWFCAWDDAAAAARFHDGLAARLRPTEVATLTLRTLRSRGRWGGHEVPEPHEQPAAVPLRPTEVATVTLRSRGRWGGHEVPEPHEQPAATVDPAGARVEHEAEANRDEWRSAPGGEAAHNAVMPQGDDGDSAAPLVVLTRARVRPTRWRPFSAAVPPVDADLAAAPGRLRSVGIGEWPVLVQGTLSIWEDAAAMTAFSRTEAHRRAVRRTGDEGWYAEELFARFAVERVQGTWDGTAPVPGGAPPGR